MVHPKSGSTVDLLAGESLEKGDQEIIDLVDSDLDKDQSNSHRSRHGSSCFHHGLWLANNETELSVQESGNSCSNSTLSRSSSTLKQNYLSSCDKRRLNDPLSIEWPDVDHAKLFSVNIGRAASVDANIYSSSRPNYDAPSCDSTISSDVQRTAFYHAPLLQRLQPPSDHGNRVEVLGSIFRSVNIACVEYKNLEGEGQPVSIIPGLKPEQLLENNNAIQNENTSVNRFHYSNHNCGRIQVQAKPPLWRLDQFETLVLYSLSTAIYYCGGTKVYKKNGLKDYFIYESCWKRIKSAFDVAISKYYMRPGEREKITRHFSEYTWTELAKQMRLLTGMKWCRKSRFFFHDMNYSWFIKLNKGQVLFDPKSFDDLLRNNCTTFDQDSNECVAECYHLYQTLKMNNRLSMSKIEKRILVGAVFDRVWSYENRGGSAITSDGKSELSKRSWRSIKKQYDLAHKNGVEKFPSYFDISRHATDKSVEDLRIQYTLIFIGSICQFEDKSESVHSMLVDWCCNLNSNWNLLSREESLASKLDDRYSDELAELDFKFQSVNLGINFDVGAKKHRLGFTCPYPLNRVIEPRSDHILDELDTNFLNEILQQNQPSSVIYYHPHDYYNQITKVAETLPAFLNGWTEIETIFVYNITRSMYRIGGNKILISSEVGNSSYNSVFEVIWVRIKLAFDHALAKYERISGDEDVRQANNRRTWRHLAHHFKVLTNINWRPENRFFYRNMIVRWNTKYNKHYLLFHPMEFSDQFQKTEQMLREQKPGHENRTAEHYSDAISTMSNLSLNEEVLLYGAVEDRALAYLNRGGSAFTCFPGTELCKRTWVSIKKQYDLAWTNAIKKYPSRFSRDEYVSMSAEELRLEYRMIFMRSLLKRNQRRSCMYELETEWFCVLNQNDEIISKSDSLASQPDDRYHKYGVPKLLSNNKRSAPEETYNYTIAGNKENTLTGKPNPKPLKRYRADNWTEDEAIILYGVMRCHAKYVQDCGNVALDGPLLKKAIKELFDIARAAYYRKKSIPANLRMFSDRTLEISVKRFTAMQEEASNNGPYEIYLRHMWLKYNEDSSLLDPDYFKRFVSRHSLAQSKNHDCDDILLFGVIIEMFVATGVIYQYSGNTNWSDSHENCWKWVKCAFHGAWEKFQSMSLHPCSSEHNLIRKSWEELSMYYLDMLTKLEGHPFFLFELHKEWIQIYNKDHKLLHPNDFDMYAILGNVPQRIPNYNIAPPQQALSTFKRAQMKVSQPEKASCTNPWTVEEEVILVGVVLDRFLSCGLLSSALKVGNGGKDCWDKIKSQFDLACYNAINRKQVQIPSYYERRRATALYRHYKYMRGAVSEQKYIQKRTKTLAHFHHEWQLLNKNGCILSNQESFCSKRTSSEQG